MVSGTVEKSLSEELVGLSPRHAVFLGEREGFGHRFDCSAEHEVARELDRVGGAGVITEIDDPLAHRLLNRPHARPRSRIAGGSDPQLSLGGYAGFAEDRRGNV